MTLEKLKSQAFDIIVQIQLLQAKLNEVNQEIVNYKPEVEDKKENKNGIQDKKEPA